MHLDIMKHWFVSLVLCLVLAMSWAPAGLAVSALVGTTPTFGMFPYQYLTSLNGQYSLVLRPDCNLVLYNFSRPLLATNTTNPPRNCSMWMQNDGNLVIYNLTWEPNISENYGVLWAQQGIVDAEKGRRSFLLIEDDGDFNFYDVNSTLRPGPYNTLNESLFSANSTGIDFGFWNASSDPAYTAWKPQVSLVDFPYMPAGYFLSAGNRLRAVSEVYSLKLGTDCNLQSEHLRYEDGSVISILWESGTKRTDNRTCQLTLQPNGILQIRDMKSGEVYWNSTRNGSLGEDNWILKVNPNNGSLSISDILDPSRILWTNKLQTQPPAPVGAPASHSGTSVALIVGVLAGGLIVLAMAAIGLKFYVRGRYLDPSERAFQKQLRAKGGTSHAFSEAKIKQATNNYRTVIGRGGFGDVFKGQLPNGQEVAAKVLSANSHQSKREFFNEIELLSMVHHKYLVSLVGYSCNRTHQVLIYEFLGGGDLRHRLQGESAGENPLSWKQRTSIILQIAEGLEYLHDKCTPPIIHRDVKSTNILLTDKLVAKVADFGLSKLKTIGQEDATHVSTMVKGTPGYLDPEYHESGSLTEKSDVYAFGIVLMEILTGRKHVQIAQFVGEAWLQEELEGLADPNLQANFNKDELVSLVKLALWCVRKSSAERPLMRQVVRGLYDLGLGDSSQPPPSDTELGEEYDRSSMIIELQAMGLEDLESDAQPFTDSSSSNCMRST